MAERLRTRVLELSLHVFGCWVMQRAIEFLAQDCPAGEVHMVIEGRKWQIELARELEDAVLKLVLNQNGNGFFWGFIGLRGILGFFYNESN